MAHIRKNDIVTVIAGKNKGKNGKVLNILTKKKRAIIEGVNLMKKHIRQTREGQKAGIIEKENSISISNLMLHCPNCSRPTRISVKILQDKSKVRICRKCGEVVAEK